MILQGRQRKDHCSHSTDNKTRQQTPKTKAKKFQCLKNLGVRFWTFATWYSIIHSIYRQIKPGVSAVDGHVTIAPLSDI